jgi:hypothetical protein
MSSAQGMFAATTSTQRLTTFGAKQATDCEVVMPTIPKPSEWQRSSFAEMFRICHSPVFSTEKEISILQKVETSDPDNPDIGRQLLQDLRAAVIRYQRRRHYEQTPTVGQRKAKLIRLEKARARFYQELTTCDPYTEEDLIRAASIDPYDPNLEPGIKPPETIKSMYNPYDGVIVPCTPHARKLLKSLGRPRVAGEKYSVNKFKKYIARVRKNLGRARLGRPPQEALDAAAVEIRDAITKATGKEPTLSSKGQPQHTYGLYLEVMRLTLEQFVGKDVSIESACRKALYGSSKRA